jgi:hypothetical protein
MRNALRGPGLAISAGCAGGQVPDPSLTRHNPRDYVSARAWAPLRPGFAEAPRHGPCIGGKERHDGRRGTGRAARRETSRVDDDERVATGKHELARDECVHYLELVNARRKNMLAEVLEWPLEERAALAHELLASLDGDVEEGVDESWATEIQRRLAAARRGEGKGPEAHSAIAELRRRLRGDG